MKRAAFTLLLLALAGSAAAEAPKKGEQRIVLHTVMGDLVLALYPDVAPLHAKQLLALTAAGVYDGTAFVRIEPNFVAQISDSNDRLTRLTPEQRKLVQRIPSEAGKLRHRRGSISMARADGDVDGAETSFSILFMAAPHLDAGYTIVGELERGWDVLEAMRRVETDPRSRPRKRLTVTSAEVVPVSQLDSMPLKGAEPGVRPVPNDIQGADAPLDLEPPETAAAAAPSGLPFQQLGLVLAMMALGLGTFLFAGRFSPKVIASLGLLVVWVGFFLLFSTVLPQLASYKSLSVLLFAGTIGLFKLMNRFESPR